jgi:hypothetical protein
MDKATNIDICNHISFLRIPLKPQTSHIKNYFMKDNFVTMAFIITCTIQKKLHFRYLKTKLNPL